MRKTPLDLEIEAKTRGKPGRPRKILSITENLRNYLIRYPYEMQKLVKALLDLAVKRGNIQAIQEIMNRIDGKVIERHEVENKQSITLVFQPVAHVGVLDKETDTPQLGQVSDIIVDEAGNEITES